MLSVSSCASTNDNSSGYDRSIVSSTFELGKKPKADQISPIEISHRVDEVIKDGRLFENYNYLRYVFEVEGLIIVANAYLTDDMSVQYFCPSTDKSPFECVDATDFESSVLEYLKRRYRIIYRSDFKDMPQVVWDETAEK